MSASRARDEEPDEKAAGRDDCPTSPHTHLTLPLLPGRTHVPLMVYVQASATEVGVTADISVLTRLQRDALTGDFTIDDVTTELLMKVREAIDIKLAQTRKSGS